MRVARNKFGVWLERLTTAAVVLVVGASTYRAFWSPFSYWTFRGPLFPPTIRTFSELQWRADVSARESDPTRREDSIVGEGKSVGGAYRLIDARMPVNARVFVSDLLGPENFRQIGFQRFLTYYLFPREVAISLGEPPALYVDRVTGRRPDSGEELQRAAYDFVVVVQADQCVVVPLGSSPMEEGTRPEPIPAGDGLIAFLLPLVVALTGSRMVRWLFRDLQGILSTGERLATGLAVGAFFLTQSALGLRLAGLRWERALAAVLMVWAAGEVVLLVHRGRVSRPRFKAWYLWWLLLIPAGLILWCQFRLAGLAGILELDAVENWAFKAKILHHFAGKEMWTWFHNPTLAYAHLDYPLLVPLLHALTYDALGRVNDFVIKFWNQWMLLLLAWAVLGAGHFPAKRPWLAGSAAGAIVLLPMTREYALTEGATIPMLFYTVLSSMQLAMGMVEKEAGRLRLGLLLLMATAMVRSEALSLLGLWVILLLLDWDSRAGLWPLRRMGWAGLLGLAAWLPYGVYRLHGPVPHPASRCVHLLMANANVVFHLLPMTWLAMLSGRFLHNDFAFWSAPDNRHAVWQGHWMGWPSLVDQWTQGVGWVCVLLLVVTWSRGGRLRWTVFQLFFVFLAFVTVVSLYWSTVQSNPTDYAAALGSNDRITGGRYLYPVLMAWFVAGTILLLQVTPASLLSPTGGQMRGVAEGTDIKPSTPMLRSRSGQRPHCHDLCRPTD